jgi:hypothetical protein
MAFGVRYVFVEIAAGFPEERFRQGVERKRCGFSHMRDQFPYLRSMDKSRPFIDHAFNNDRDGSFLRLEIFTWMVNSASQTQQPEIKKKARKEARVCTSPFTER